MRKLFAVLLALLTPAALFGQTHVLFTLSDFNASPATNRSVTVQKLQPFPGNLVTYSSGASGTFYVSNATVGDYDCVILKKGTASEIAFQVTVTATNLGVIGANTNTSVRGIQSYPTSGKSAWTILSSDARYSTNASSGGSATNVYLAPGSARIAVTTNSAGNWSVDVPTGVTNDSYTSATTYADAQRVAATNATGILAITAQQTNQTQILALTAQQTNQAQIQLLTDYPLTNSDTRSVTITNLYWKTNSGQSFFGGSFGFTDDDQSNIGSQGGTNGIGRPKHLYVAQDIHGLNHYGAGGALTYTASSFNGNLATTVNTLQELADAVDDLALGAGGAASNAVTTIGTNDVNLTTAATNLNFVAGTGVSLVGSSNNSGTVKIVLTASSYTNNSTGTPGTITGQGISTNLSSVILNTPDAGTGKSSGTNTYLLNPYFGSPDDGTGQHLQLFQAYSDTAWRLGSFNWTNGGAYISNAIATSPALGDDDTSVATTEWVRDSITNRGPLNVKDYGAVGDGVANDTAAIQSALDAAGLYKGMVYIPKGRYFVSNTIYIPQNITLYGEHGTDYYGTFLDSTNSDQPTLWVTNSGVVISGLWIRGSDQTKGVGVRVGGVAAGFTGFKLEQVKAEGRLKGFELNNAWSGELESCFAFQNTHGLWLSNTVNAVTVTRGNYDRNTNGIYADMDNSVSVHVQNATIQGNTRGGIVETNQHGTFSINNNYFEANGNYDVSVYGSLAGAGTYDNTTIRDNWFSTSKTNVYLVNAKNITLADNSGYNTSTNFISADISTTFAMLANNKTPTVSVNAATNAFVMDGTNVVLRGLGLIGLIRNGEATNAAGSSYTTDDDIDTIAEVEAIWGRKVATNNATMTASTLIIGDGARGITTTTTGSGVLTALGNTANGASGFLLYDAELAALGGLTSAADKIPYFTGSGTAGLVTIGTGLSFSGGTLSATSATQYFYTNSVAAGSISNNFDVKIDGDLEVTGSTSFSNLYATNFFIPGQSNGIAAIQSDGSVKATNTPVVTSVDLGLATDTTLTRSSAGNLAIEGNVVYRAGGTDIAVADGGTGLSSGTSGGILGYTASGTLASSAALAANAIVVGGGAGATPTAVSEWTVTATSLTTPAGSATLTMGNKAGDNLLLQGEIYGKGIGLTNIPIVTSVTIPMGAFSTNNVTVTDKTPASAVTATNSGDTFYFTDAITNVVHGRFALPYDWNAGVVRVGLRAFCTGTNSLSLTNTVWFVRAAAIGNGDRPDNPTWGTAVYMTNGLTTNSWTSREGITGDLTVGNTPTIAKSILWEIGRAGAASGDTLTNSSVALEEVRIYLQRNTSTNWPTASP